MSASTLAVNRANVRAAGSDLGMLLVLALCFALSGLAALVYQTAWMRQFALVFGTSELAVATVLAAYMGGLALGARLIERFLPRIRRPVLVYAGLEFGIGAGALVLVPAVLLATDWLLQALFGGQPAPPDSDQVGTSLFYLASAFAALALPTTLMGATLPLLARHAVRTEAQIGRRIGLLYATNTAGAVAGALLSAFWLLPNLGLRHTVWVGAALNFAVLLLIAPLVQRKGSAGAAAGAAAAAAPARARFAVAVPPAAFWVLPLMLLSGAVAFFHEVLWTRMLSHVVGGSIYAFGVMVASFLAGIALGGMLGALLARDRRWAVRALAGSQLGCALAAAVAFVLLERLVPEKAGLAGNAFFGALLLMPLTLFVGMTYPLAVRVLAARPEEAAAASARVYAWNTVGAIAGALAAGFVLIPWLRFEGAIQLAVATSAVLAVAAIWLLEPPGRGLGAAVSAAALAVVVAFRPAEPRELLLASPLNVSNEGELLFYGVGRSASVVVLAQDGTLTLRTNGLPEALMETTGAPPRFSGEFWLSPLAVLARPDTERMLIVGFGGGVIVEGVPPSVDEVDVIELEPLVLEANRATRALRKRDPLGDPRVNLIVNDARGALALTARRYDAIVSQPSHPWTAGASHLYTREFMQLARARLTEGGVFVQWMNVNFLDERLLRSLAATLLEVFGNVRIYRPDPNTLVFLASDGPLEPERRLLATGLPLAYSPGHYQRYGIHVVEDLFAALAADEDGVRALARGADVITDDGNRMATSSVYELGRGLTAEGAGRALAAYDPLQRPQSWVYRELGERLEFGYIAQRLATFQALDASTADRLFAVSRALGPTAAGYRVRVIAAASAGRGEQAESLLREALAIHPEDEALRFEYVRRWLGPLARGTAPPEVEDAAARLTGAAAAVIEAGRHAARDEWAALPELDPVLARARWTDPWKLEAVQLRADWRSRVTNEEVRRRYANEALAMIDQAMVQHPTLALYGLRARSALSAERIDVIVESIWGYGQAAYQSALVRPGERAAVRASLESLVRLLAEHEDAAGTYRGRLQEVRRRLEDAVSRLAEA